MDEISFKTLLSEWRMKSRDVIIPTSGLVLLYGQKHKVKIIPTRHEDLIYTCVKRLEDPSDELYNKLTQKLGYDNLQVLKYIQDIYESYLIDIRKSIRKLQSEWSRSFCQGRANKIIGILGYDNILPICDLVNDRLVPIELVLKVTFNIDSKYGDHRRKKDKSEVYIDPRVQKFINDRKEFNSRTVIHPRKSQTPKILQS